MDKYDRLCERYCLLEKEKLDLEKEYSELKAKYFECFAVGLKSLETIKRLQDIIYQQNMIIESYQGEA